MDIVGTEYQVTYHGDQSKVSMAGKLRLDNLESYQPILELLTGAIALSHPHLTLDLRDLIFLNSSGLSMLLMFVVRLRETDCMGLTILGSATIPWQLKSLNNLRRLMPDMKLDLISP